MIRTRLAFVIALVLGGSLGPAVVAAQDAGKVARVGYLAYSGGAFRLPDSFHEGLRDLGYVEGRNLLIEPRYAEGKPERYPELANELAALKVDLFVTVGTLGRRPVVFIGVGDPVLSGLATSLGRPGGNATGLSIVSPDLNSKRLELLTQVVPGVSRVAVLWQPGDLEEPTEIDRIKRARVAGRALGVQLHFAEARGSKDLDRAFAEMVRAQAGALIVLENGLFWAERERLVNLATKHKLPAVYSLRGLVDIGGLMSYGPDYADLFRRAATYLDKILKGAKPSDLHIEQPTKFQLVINVKTAKALGLTIPRRCCCERIRSSSESP